MCNYINNNCIDSLSHFLGIFMHMNIRTFMHAYVHTYNVTSLPFLIFTANPEGALYSPNCLMRAECSQIPITWSFTNWCTRRFAQLLPSIRRNDTVVMRHGASFCNWNGLYITGHYKRERERKRDAINNETTSQEYTRNLFVILTTVFLQIILLLIIAIRKKN